MKLIFWGEGVESADCWKVLFNCLKNLEQKINNQEQYSRKNCLLIHGLTETKTEDTDEMVLDVINK